MTDTIEGLLPLEEVHTPTLDLWARDGYHRRDRGWVNWIDPAAEYRVGVEVVELHNPDADRIVTAFELTLWEVAGDGPDDQVLRETVMNSRLVTLAAESVATNAEAFAGEWDEGLAPRPADIDP